MTVNDTVRDDDLLTIDEVAEMLRIPVATLRYWRHLGDGPQSFKVGRRVVDWRHAVRHWLQGQSTPTATSAGAS